MTETSQQKQTQQHSKQFGRGQAEEMVGVRGEGHEEIGQGKEGRARQGRARQRRATQGMQ